MFMNFQKTRKRTKQSTEGKTEREKETMDKERKATEKRERGSERLTLTHTQNERGKKIK